jgi:hypothetical protein
MRSLPRFWSITLVRFLSVFSMYAQQGEQVYSYLAIPVSVWAAGNGGNLVSSPVQDVNLVFHNPALLNAAMDRQLSVSYLNYLADINAGSLAYARSLDPSRQWMAGIRYMNYGTMKWVTPENTVLGETTASDLSLTGTYAWKLSSCWRAGGTIDLLY